MKRGGGLFFLSFPSSYGWPFGVGGAEVIEFLLQVAQETWFVVKEAAIFLLFGFLVAGVLAVLMPLKTLLRFFGTGKIKSVLWASTLGMPLPLCSCGVLPTALGLRRQGATPGATVSFLIATPETGIDSISLSYALLDPLMTIFRPLSAMATAIAAGIATNFWGDRQTTTEPRQNRTTPIPTPPCQNRIQSHPILPIRMIMLPTYHMPRAAIQSQPEHQLGHMRLSERSLPTLFETCLTISVTGWCWALSCRASWQFSCLPPSSSAI